MTPTPEDVLRGAALAHDLHAADRWEALGVLVDRLVAAGRLEPALRAAVTEAVAARERSFPTALGFGVALPHCFLTPFAAPALLLGRFSTGIPFDAPDDQPVRLALLMVSPDTPAGHESHLKLLAAAARLFLAPGLIPALLTAEDSEGFRASLLQFLGIPPPRMS